MSHQIIKQPNGLYAIFSTVVDDFIWTDCTPEDIIEMRTKEAVESIRKDILDTVSELESGGKPYYQFTMTFDEAVDWIRTVHRKDTASLKSLGVPPKPRRARRKALP
jgi:hypothetical protein